MYGTGVSTCMQRSKFINELIDWWRPSSLLCQLLQLADGIRRWRCTAAIIVRFFLTFGTSSMTTKVLNTKCQWSGLAPLT